MSALDHVRHGRITGSRIGKLLGYSPYGTPDDLMREMVREYFWEESEFAGNVATEWGTAHEAEAVAELEMRYPVNVTGRDAQGKVSTVTDSTLNHLAYTPDGYLTSDQQPGIGLLEVKAPYRATYTSLMERPDYEAQVQLGLHVLGLEWGMFAIWRNRELLPPEIFTRDPGWFTTVAPVMGAFIADYRAIIGDQARAAPYREPLVDERTDAEWSAEAGYYLDLKAQVEVLTRRMEEAKSMLIALTDGRTTKGAGVHLIRGSSGGSVSYRAALKHYAPDADLTQFKTGSTNEPTWTIRKAGK